MSQERGGGLLERLEDAIAPGQLQPDPLVGREQLGRADLEAPVTQLDVALVLFVGAVDTAEQLGQPGEQGAQLRRDTAGAGHYRHLLGECGEGLFGLHATEPSQLAGERSVHEVVVDGPAMGLDVSAALKPPRAR